MCLTTSPFTEYYTSPCRFLLCLDSAVQHGFGYTPTLIMAAGIVQMCVHVHLLQMMNRKRTAHFPTQHVYMTQAITQPVRYAFVIVIQADVKVY